MLKKLTANDQYVTLQLWDTAGQERSVSIYTLVHASACFLTNSSTVFYL